MMERSRFYIVDHEEGSRKDREEAQTPGRATVYGKPAGTAKMLRLARFLAVFSVPIAVWVGIYVFGPDMVTIASYGIPVALLVTGVYILGSEYLGSWRIGFIRSKESDDRGIVAEIEVGNVLNSLPAGYFVIHDYDTGHGNIDHVIMGPKGIFTVETKSYGGLVSVAGNRLMKNNRQFEKDPISQSHAEMAILRERLKRGGVEFDRMDSIVVFSRARVKVQERVNGVAVVSLRYLPKFLESLPDRMSSREAAKAYACLMKAARSRKGE